MILKKFIFFISVTVCCLTAQAQLNVSFFNYLDSLHLKREQEAYIHSVSNSTTPDSIAYLKAKFYFQYYNDSLFFDNYIHSKLLFINDSLSFRKANIRFLTSPGTQQKKWFNSIDSNGISFSVKQIKNVYNASVSPLNFSINTIPIALQADFLKYKTSYKKKAVVAGGLSVLVPGLGKLYGGRKKAFIVTLLTNGILAAQTSESIYRLGIEHPFSIFSLSVFSVFYLANVYSSYYDIRQVKEETRTQFLINASDYFNSTYTVH